jgi:putative transposase
MARIDALYLENPCSGSRRMGLREIYQKPRTTLPGGRSKRFPCLVDLSQVMAVNQVWATDITYVPLQKGCLFLVAIVDHFSRHELSWKLSNSLDTEFCLDALEIGIAGAHDPSSRYKQPQGQTNGSVRF